MQDCSPYILNVFYFIQTHPLIPHVPHNPVFWQLSGFMYVTAVATAHLSCAPQVAAMLNISSSTSEARNSGILYNWCLG